MLKRNFSKGLAISNFLASLFHKYMKFGISMTNTKRMVWESVKYLIIFLIYVTWSKNQHTFRRKTVFVYSFKYPNKETEKILKSEAKKLYLEPCQISKMECFCENTTAKTFIIDVWCGSRYTPEVVQDSEIKLKWMNTKMLQKAAFLQYEPCRGDPYVEIS